MTVTHQEEQVDDDEECLGAADLEPLAAPAGGTAGRPRRGRARPGGGQDQGIGGTPHRQPAAAARRTRQVTADDVAQLTTVDHFLLARPHRVRWSISAFGRPDHVHQRSLSASCCLTRHDLMPSVKCYSAQHYIRPHRTQRNES